MAMLTRVRKMSSSWLLLAGSHNTVWKMLSLQVRQVLWIWKLWGHFQDSGSELHRESLGYSTDAPGLFYKAWQTNIQCIRHRTGTLYSL